MSQTPSAHNLLDAFQQEVLRTIAALPEAADFALGGGTALAEFYLGHRRSEDLDFFSLSGEGVADLGRRVREDLPRRIEGVRVSALRAFAAHHRYLVGDGAGNRILVDIGNADPGLLGAVHRVGAVRVLDLDDLAVGKMMALHDRVELKDAVDIRFLADAGYDLGWLRRRALERDPGLRDAPLVIVENLGRMAPSRALWPVMVRPLDSEQLAAFLATARERLLRDIKTALPR